MEKSHSREKHEHTKVERRFDLWSTILLGLTMFFIIVGMFFSFSFAGQDREDTKKLLDQANANNRTLVELLNTLNCLSAAHNLNIPKTQAQCEKEAEEASQVNQSPTLNLTSQQAREALRGASGPSSTAQAPGESPGAVRQVVGGVTAAVGGIISAVNPFGG